MALLIRSNIFVECARGVIGSFIKMWLPGCPAIVCHSEHIASEFFMANTTSSVIGHEFVSVVNVQEDSSDVACLAFLAPLLPWDAPNMEGTLHVLPNGDVRVIQSPADDVMMCSPSEEAMHTTGDSALSALKFECSERELMQLIGAHFHIGELITDADIESRNRKLALLHLNSRFGVSGCWEGLLTAVAFICEVSLKSNGGCQLETPQSRRH